MEKDLDSLWSDIIDAYNSTNGNSLCKRLQELIAEKYDTIELDEMVESWFDEGDTWLGTMNECIEEEDVEFMRFVHEYILIEDNIDIFKTVHKQYCE